MSSREERFRPVFLKWINWQISLWNLRWVSTFMPAVKEVEGGEGVEGALVVVVIVEDGEGLVLNK